MSSLSYKELVAQREALEAKISEARAIEAEKALAQIRELVETFEFVAVDVFPPVTRGRRGESSLKGRTVLPKFRHPETGQTWTGRGKPPVWIANEEDREKFAI